jgi:prevent-host-death family protein
MVVGVRELKARLSEILRRVQDGEAVTVTDRGRPVARLVPAETDALETKLWTLVAAGKARWSGGKPRGGSGGPTFADEPFASAVVEDRR